MKKQINTKIAQGGYSDSRLQPCYLMATTLILLLVPAIGITSAYLIVAAPALYLAVKIIRRQEKNEILGKATDKAIQTLQQDKVIIIKLPERTMISA